MSLARYHIAPDNSILCQIAETHRNGSVDLVSVETGEVMVIMAPVATEPTLGYATPVADDEPQPETQPEPQPEPQPETKAKPKKPKL